MKCNVIDDSASEPLQPITIRIQDVLQSPEMRKAVEQWKAITKSIRQIDAEKLMAISQAMKAAADTVQKAELLGEYGWTLPMIMTPFQLHRILALDDPAAIDAAFVDFYSAEGGVRFRKLRDTLLSNTELERWRSLLVQCCAAYERQEYLIVVPSLLTVLEGAIAMPNKVRFIKGPDRAMFFDAKIANTNPDSVKHYMWRSVNAFVKALFEYSDFVTSPEPDRLNRHWILHGRDVPDWDISDCLRLFQAIGTVTRLG